MGLVFHKLHLTENSWYPQQSSISTKRT